MISHKWRKDQIVITTNGTFPWSFGNHKTFETIGSVSRGLNTLYIDIKFEIRTFFITTLLTQLYVMLAFYSHVRSWHGLTTPLFFSNFLFTNVFSIKFLYFFIISSLFPYFILFVSIFIQSSRTSNCMCRPYIDTNLLNRKLEKGGW